MAENKLEGADLKKMIKLGKKKALSFAFCPGSKNEHTMLIDRRKSPEMLGKLARQEGESNKVGFGTFEVKGRVMEMTCGRTIPQMAKTIKKYLKTQKVLINIVILDSDGKPLDSDVEDLPPDPTMESADENQAQAPTPDNAEETPNQAATLVERLKALQPTLASASGETAEKLKKVMAAAVAQIKSSDFEKAETTITALEKAFEKLGRATPQTKADAPPTGQDMQALAARAKAAQAAIAGFSEPAKGKLTKALTLAVKNIKSQDHAAADTLLAKIENALNKANASKETVASAENGTSDLTSEQISKLRESWVSTLADIRKDVESLKSAIDSATSGVDGMENVPAKSSVLFSYLDEINGDLEQTLQNMANEQDDGARANLKNAALKIVENYKGLLDKGFFKDVDNNGFVKTDIRNSALNSLKQVSNALAA